jgi:hypothetical protein
MSLFHEDFITTVLPPGLAGRPGKARTPSKSASQANA